MDGNGALCLLELGDHVCCPAGGRAERYAAAVAGTACGLDRDQKVIFFVDDPDRLRQHLAAEVDGAERAMAAGQLAVHPGGAAYLSASGFDADQILELVADEIDQAERQGFNGLRATGDLSGIAGQARHAEAVIEYELRLSSIYAGGRIIGICHYDPDALPAPTWQRVVTAHPSTIASTGQSTVARLRGVRTPAGLRIVGEVDLTNRDAFAELLAEATTRPGACEIDATGLTYADAWAAGCLLRTAGARSGSDTTIVCSPHLAGVLARCGATILPDLTVLRGGAR